MKVGPRRGALVVASVELNYVLDLRVEVIVRRRVPLIERLTWPDRALRGQGC